MDEREKLIEAVREVQRKAAAEKMREMSDRELQNLICSYLGLPPGITFSDEQLLMLAKHSEEFATSPYLRGSVCNPQLIGD